MIRTNENFLNEVKQNNKNDLDFSKVVYKGIKKHVTVICPIHGEFNILAYSLLKGAGCKICNKSKSAKRSKQQLIDKEYFIKLSRDKHGDKYDYSKVILNRMSDKVIITCPIHGDFEQTASNHTYGYGCKKCGNDVNIKSKFEYIDMFETIEFEHNYDYSKVEYINNKTPITIICPIHGDFRMTPKGHLYNKSECPKCTTNALTSKQERLLLNSLAHFQYIQNDRKILSGHEIDILIDNVGIEVNGRRFHNEKYNRGRNYHLNKTINANLKSIQLLHFWDDEIEKQYEVVLSMINSKLGKTTKIFARKCEVRVVDKFEASSFLSHTHLQGNKSVGTICCGLYYNNELIQIMTFGKPRFDKQYDWELIRMSSKLNTTVVGGASRLLNYFKKRYSGSIISYANRRWSNGNVYDQLGFNFVRATTPGYFYTNGTINISRHQAQKHKLSKLLGDKFDPNLTELENMSNVGYYRAFDCGNLVYELD